MKLGISSYALTWAMGVSGYPAPVIPLSVNGLIHLAHQLGVKRVQIADNAPLMHWSNNQLQELRKSADLLQVSLEVGTRGTDPELMLRYLEIAKILGSNLVRTLITHDDIECGERDIRQVLPNYQTAGMLIAIENHGLHTTGQLTQLFENLHSPWVGSCLDTVNSFGALEGPKQVISKLAPYLVNLHIKDFEIKRVDHQMGFVILGTPAGSGRLDMSLLATTLQQYNTEASVILELWTPFTDTITDTIALEKQWLLESLAYLQNPTSAFSVAKTI